jgi:hypothetical protein
VAQWTYGNGRMMSRTLNQNGQPGIVQVNATGGLSLGYEFDEVGNLKKLRNGNQTDPPLRTYSYDRLNRLTETRNGSTNALLQGYAYDKTGNRTSATVGSTTTAYTYPAGSHRLRTVGWALCPPLRQLNNHNKRFLRERLNLDRFTRQRLDGNGGHKAHPTQSPVF